MKLWLNGKLWYSFHRHISDVCGIWYFIASPKRRNCLCLIKKMSGSPQFKKSFNHTSTLRLGLQFYAMMHQLSGSVFLRAVAGVENSLFYFLDLRASPSSNFSSANAKDEVSTAVCPSISQISKLGGPLHAQIVLNFNKAIARIKTQFDKQVRLRSSCKFVSSVDQNFECEIEFFKRIRRNLNGFDLISLPSGS